jgi:hypothetical protein
MKIKSFGVVIVALVLVLALFGVVGAQADNGAPLPGTVMNVQTVTILDSQVITTDQRSAGIDISRYNGGDLFVTVQAAPASALTTTLQFSGDGIGFANCYWNATKSDGMFTVNLCRTIQTTSGTTYIKTAFAGQQGRLDLDVTGTVTVTAVLVQRNN